MDLLYLLRILLKRKWIILGAALLAGLIAYFFTRNQPKNFRSGSRISTGFTITDEVKVNKENFSFYEADTKFNNAIVTFSSPAVTSLVSYTLILHDLDSATRPFRVLTNEEHNSAAYKSVNKEEAKKVFAKKLAEMKMLTSFDPEEKKLLEFLGMYGYDYKTIAQNLNIYRVERTDYIQIDYVSSNPELSAFVANDIYKEFLRYFQDVRSNRSQESIDTLKSLMERKRQELQIKKGLIGGDVMLGLEMQGGSKLDLIANLEQNLNDERNDQIRLQSELQKVQQKLSNLRSSSSGSSSSNSENDELIELRKAKNKAFEDYINGGSTDEELKKKYDDLNDKYQRKFQNIGKISNSSAKEEKNEELLKTLTNQKNDLLIDIQAAGQRVGMVQAKINALKGSVASDANRSVTSESLMKDVDLAEKEYLEAKTNYSNATDFSGSSVNNFRQVLLAQPAIAPEPSKRLMLVGMAAFGALFTTMLVIIILSYLDSSVKTPAVFSRLTKLKLISIVNFTDLQKHKLAEILSPMTHVTGPESKRANVFRESIRKLRYEVEKTGKKIFLFTSTKKGMGKTTLIQALAYSLSLSKKKILIIDTNFSNNDLTVQLEAEPILERTYYTTTSAESLLEQVKENATKLESNRIYVIGSEGGDYTPAEILPQDNILKHLHLLTKEFDFIFLEGPPLNDFSDSRELAQYADGVIAVFAADKSIKQIDKESINFYKEMGDKFCGTILNKINLENINVT